MPVVIFSTCLDLGRKSSILNRLIDKQRGIGRTKKTQRPPDECEHPLKTSVRREL
jgi:hypothetical protein